jgi:hypothetical protein
MQDYVAGNADRSRYRRLQNSKYSCMLLDSSSFTSGLNLEMTTDIICMHKLELGTRAADRASSTTGRIGTLTVHDILHENERRWRGLKTNDTMYSISFTDTSSHHAPSTFTAPLKNATGEYRWHELILLCFGKLKMVEQIQVYEHHVRRQAHHR